MRCAPPASPRRCVGCQLKSKSVQCRYTQACAKKRLRRSFLTGKQRLGCEVYALDAAQPFDYESRMHDQLVKKKQLKVGVVGFGTFGQFLSKRLVEAGHLVLATSRSPYFDKAAELGVEYFTDIHDFCEEHPDVVILSTSIISLEAVIKSLPFQRLKRNTLLVDVLSVKEFPKRLLLRLAPPELDVLCTHPMFGPDSGSGSWKDLNFMYEKVRIGSSETRQKRAETFLQFFEQEGCRMVEMTCEEHDRIAASSQFITHTVGRVLGAMNLERSEIDTKGFDSLMNLVENTTHDSFDLYYGLFMYNQNATEELAKLERAFDDVKGQLFDRLHSKLREEIFHQDTASQSPKYKPNVLPPRPDPLALPPPSKTESKGSNTGDKEGDLREASTKNGGVPS